MDSGSDYSAYSDYSDGVSMIRTQIQLTEEQSARLHESARRSGVSVAQIIRVSVDDYLRREAAGLAGTPSRDAAASVAGMFHSGRGDVAARHDDYLDEAYAE
jgi:hypothetical protein